MGYNEVIEAMIDEKLMNMSTAFIGKVISCNADRTKATIQPLTMVKQYGKSAEMPSVVSNAPVLNSARYKVEVEGNPKKFDIKRKPDNVLENPGAELTTIKVKALDKGDVVLCVCCDRDITKAKKGEMSTPPVGHHSQSDSVVIGIL